MKVSQVIILLAATLAIVAFGIASAGGLFGKKKNEVQKDPCVHHDNHEACDICCRKHGQVSGKYIRDYIGQRVVKGCKCYDSELWGVLSELPEWRLREQEQLANQSEHSEAQSSA